LVGVQLVAINQGSSGVSGQLYADYIWVSAGAPKPTTVIFSDTFGSGTAGWFFQIYGDATSAGVWSNVTSNLIITQTGGQKGQASYLFGFPSTGHSVLASVWVYSTASSMNNTQKVYLYVFDNGSTFTPVIASGNAILQPRKWTPGQWRQLQFGYIPVSIYNSVQLVGINPAGNSLAGLYFDTLEIKQ
jgi:hypothetical protein